jgi:hypothetical protein
MRRVLDVVVLVGIMAAGLRPGAVGTASAAQAPAGDGDPTVLSLMARVNTELRARGLRIAAHAVELYTIGGGRPEHRVHQAPGRWVAGDGRRLAQGNDLTYLVDQSEGAANGGLTNAETEAAIDRAMHTWDTDRCLGKVALVKRPDSGADPDILDGILGFGGFGNPFLADMVHAGWMPPAFFEAFAPGGGTNFLALTVTFIFLEGPNGPPTDSNGDQYLDVAFTETYYNNQFTWGINGARPQIDVETVALHESGHALSLGHFGPPPAALMNPRYLGIQQAPRPTDRAGMCALWQSWPK